MRKPAANQNDGGTASLNAEVAKILREIASVLALQGANHFRVNAYRRGADTIDALDVDLPTLINEHGSQGLMDLPGIGRGLAAVISEILRTGGAARLDRLNGASEPGQVFQSVPGIGPGLAHAIHETLDIDSLEELEIAAHDGRLASVAGIGPRRLAAIRAGLAQLLGHRAKTIAAPDVAVLLDIDREYRERVSHGKLPLITPRRFNPLGKRWLPILHTDRAGWHFTALFSNTARAHQLNRTHDWVVIYAYDDDHRESQHTVVTERGGDLAGQRVVRGRELECRAYYD